MQQDQQLKTTETISTKYLGRKKMIRLEEYLEESHQAWQPKQVHLSEKELDWLRLSGEGLYMWGAKVAHIELTIRGWMK